MLPKNAYNETFPADYHEYRPLDAIRDKMAAFRVHGAERWGRCDDAMVPTTRFSFWW
jgi:hypothetical protein